MKGNSNMDAETLLKTLDVKIDALYQKVAEIKTYDDMRILNIKQIAEMFGMSYKSLYHKKWLLPNYGEGLIMGSKAEWTKKEVDQWINEMPLEERKKLYFEKGLDSAKKALRK